MKDETQKPSTSSSSPATSFSSSRNDVIRDIESHIEIIFECFDFDDSVGATTTKTESSSANSSTENVPPETTSPETADNKSTSEKTEDSTEPDNKKNENNSD
jgi:hypothetical protein